MTSTVQSGHNHETTKQLGTLAYKIIRVVQIYPISQFSRSAKSGYQRYKMTFHIFPLIKSSLKCRGSIETHQQFNFYLITSPVLTPKFQQKQLLQQHTLKTAGHFIITSITAQWVDLHCRVTNSCSAYN